MAQIHFTLNQDEVSNILKENKSEFFRLLLEKSLNAFIQIEHREQIGADSYERTESRKDVRNGSRKRKLTTRIGTVILTIPRNRDAPFKTLLFDNYSRSEAALITTMAEMVINGVSTAKVGKVMEEICGRSYSKQTVSEACKELDKEIKAFRETPIEKDYLFIIADATYLKVRENKRVVPKAFMTAIGLTLKGEKELIGFDVFENESKATWKTFFKDLKARGLDGMCMCTSDDHGGLVSAFQEVYPNVAWQRCQAHFRRNITEAAPKNWRIGLSQDLTKMFNAKTIKTARKQRDEILKDYKDKAPNAMKILDEGFEDAMTVMMLPENMRVCIRTSNYIERLNTEIKRRSKVVGVFPNQKSVIRLIGSVIIDEYCRWQSQRQIYFKPIVQETLKVVPELEKIAKKQQGLRKAA